MPLEDRTMELHPTWGGAGTLIWHEFDMDIAKVNRALGMKG